MCQVVLNICGGFVQSSEDGRWKMEDGKDPNKYYEVHPKVINVGNVTILQQKGTHNF